MIVTCPSCDARYLVDSKQIGLGRQVKCARCNFSWHCENETYLHEDLVIDEKEKYGISSPSKNTEKEKKNVNLPAVYEKQVSQIPFLFIILVTVSIAVLIFEVSKNLNFNPDVLNRFMDSSIELIVNKIRFFLSEYF